jgi:hypothetical protein
MPDCQELQNCPARQVVKMVEAQSQILAHNQGQVHKVEPAMVQPKAEPQVAQLLAVPVTILLQV